MRRILLLLAVFLVMGQLMELDPSYDVLYKPMEKVSYDDSKATLDPVVYDTDEVFSELFGNTESCREYCYAQYEFTNTFSYDVDLRKSLGMEFYDLRLLPSPEKIVGVWYDVSGDDEEMSGYRELSDIPSDIAVVKAGEKRVIRVMAKKGENVDIEWMPVLNLQKTDISALPVEEVSLRQTAWSLWLKGSPSSEAIPSGIRAWYKFDEASGTSATDSSGNSFTGTTSGATVNQLGYYNRSYSFDGVDDYVKICDEAICTWSQSVCDNGCSFCAWVKPSSGHASSGNIVARHDGTGDNAFWNFRVRGTTNRVDFNVYRNGTESSTVSSAYSTATAPVGIWTHVCGVFTGGMSASGVAKVYTNGTLRTTASTSLQLVNGAEGWDGTEDAFIGVRDDTDLVERFNGTIDDVMVYNKALTSAEVSQIYSGTPSLLAYYKLDEPSGTTANDDSRNNYDGATTGATVAQTGVFNKSYSFDGVGDYVKVCDEPTCTWSKTMCDNGCSVCVWFKAYQLGVSRALVGRYDTGDTFFWLRNYPTTNKLRFAVYGNGSSSTTVSTAIVTADLVENRWYHVCGVFNGSSTFEGNSMIFIDGKHNHTATLKVQIQTGVGGWGDDEDTFIGSTDDGVPSTFWNGTLDDVMLFSTPLTSTEILDLYERGLTEVVMDDPVDGYDYPSQNVPVDAYIYSHNLLNVSYWGVSESEVVLYDGGVNNQSSIFLDRVNSTAWRVHGSEVLDFKDGVNFTVRAWGGEGYVTSERQSSISSYGQTGGTCQTQQGYRFTHTAGVGTEYTILNMSGLVSGDGRLFCRTSECGNVQVVNAPSYLGDPYQLIVDTQTNKSFTVYVGGFDQFTDRVTTTPSGDIVTLNLVEANLTIVGKAYWIDFRDELTSGYIDKSQYSNYTLTVICQSKSPDSYDMKIIGWNTTLLTTSERPIFWLTADTMDRKYQSYLDEESFTMYMMANGTEYEEVSFALEDYVGQFANSYLIIKKNINATLQPVSQMMWYHLRVEGIDLMNDTYYQYVLYTPTQTRIIVWDKIVNGDDKTIVTREPIIDDGQNYDNKLLLATTSSYAGHSVGAVWNSTGNLTHIRFKVYNQNASTYAYYIAYDYNDTSPTESGTVDYTSINQNNTYYVEVTGVVDGVSYVYNTIVNPRQSGGVDGIFSGNLMMPSSMLGLTARQILTAVSMALITMVAMMFGAVNVGVGVLVVVAVGGALILFDWINYLTVSAWVFLLAIAVVEALTMGRTKTK